MEITGKYIDINNTKIYYEIIGNPENSGIVCIHPSGRDSRQWHGFMELMSSDYFIVSFDMPGHSKSWPLENEEYCLKNADDISEFIWTFIKKIKLDNPMIIGCSIGGNIVFQLAADYRDEVKAIISLEGADYTPTISKQTLDMITNPYVDFHFSNYDFSESLIGKNCPSDVKHFLIYTVFQMSPYAHKGDLTAYTNFDVREKMDEIICPVLMIRGKDDWIVSSERVQQTFNRLTNTSKKELVELEGIGHFPQVEDPALVKQVVVDFLNKYNI